MLRPFCILASRIAKIRLTIEDPPNPSQTSGLNTIES